MNLIEYLPLFLIISGLIAFVVGSFLVNIILGVFILGVALVIAGLLCIPIKIERK